MQLPGLLRAVARADREDAAALRLLLGRVRQDDAAERRLLFLEDLDDQPIAKRLQIHSTTSVFVRCDSGSTLSPRVPEESNRSRQGCARDLSVGD